MEVLQTWLGDSRALLAVGGFLAAVIAAFVAGFVVGRAGRPREAARIPPPVLGGPEDAQRLPELGGDAMRRMEPPPPPDVGPPPRRR